MSRLSAKKYAHAAGIMHSMIGFIGTNQRHALFEALRGEEGDGFLGTIQDLRDTFATMPKTYEQDGKGDSAMVHMHFFNANTDWYVTEKDMEPEQLQAYGYVKRFAQDGKMAYISLVEMAEHNMAEVDLYWTPKTIGDIKSGL